MGYQEYAVRAKDIDRFYEILEQEGVLTGLSVPVCFGKARIKTGPIQPGEKVLLMAGERHGNFFVEEALTGEQKQVLDEAEFLSLDDLVLEREYEDLFEDIPLEETGNETEPGGKET